MRSVLFVVGAALAVSLSSASAQTPQTPPALPMGGAARPQTPGITRTTLADDAKKTVTRVEIIPGAGEPPHTHATEMVLIPVTDGSVEWNVNGKIVTSLKAGEALFVPANTTHSLKNTGKQKFEAISIAVK